MNASSPSPRDSRSSPTTRAGRLRNFLYESTSTQPRQGRFFHFSTPAVSHHARSGHASGVRGSLPPVDGGKEPLTSPIGRRADAAVTGVAKRVGPAGLHSGSGSRV